MNKQTEKKDGGKTMYQEIKLIDILITAQPRKDFNDSKMSELKKSIEEQGVISPILVRKKGKKYELVYGERRYRASKDIGLEIIPSIVKELDDKQVMEARFIENIQREDLTAMEEAEGFNGLIKKCGYTQEDISKKIGKSQPYVANRLRLLELPKEILTGLKEDKITPGHAIVILRLTDIDRQKKLYKEIIERKLSIKRAENQLGEYGYCLQINEAPFDTKDCKVCASNGSKQEDLFDKDTKIKGQCLNAECYNKKIAKYFDEKLKKYRANKIPCVPYNDFSDKFGYNTSTIRHQGRPLDKEFKKVYDEKCVKCPKFAVCYDKRVGDIEEICTDSSCYRKLRYKDTGSTGTTTRDNDYGMNMKIDTLKREIWYEEIEKKAKEKLPYVMILCSLIEKHDKYEGSLIKEVFTNLGIIKKGEKVKHPYIVGDINIEKIYGAKLDKVKKEIERIIVKNEIDRYENKQLHFISKGLGFDMTKHFLITEEYLMIRTKGQLIKLCKELKLDMKKIRSTGKKSEFIEDILKNVKKGTVPKDIKSIK